MRAEHPMNSHLDFPERTWVPHEGPPDDFSWVEGDWWQPPIRPPESVPLDWPQLHLH